MITQQIWHRLQLLVAQGRGMLTSKTKVQTTVMEGETPPDVKRIEPYGFSYRPISAGFETYVVFPSGDRSRGLCLIIGDKRYEMDIQPGEVALHDDQGQSVYLKRDKIVINTPFDFEVRAKNIKLHATESYQLDVNGQGQKWDGEGVETWQDDDIAKPHHPHSPPEI